VFLDNIEAVPLDLQVKLLSVVQSGRPCTTCGEVDVRLVVASSKNLDDLAARGEFNENLYYRLSALEIDIPPLHSRVDDIPLLIAQAIRQHLAPGAEAPTLDSEVRDIFYRYTWPGNLRELTEAIRHALSLAKNGVITKEMLPATVVEAFDEGVRSDVIPNRRDQSKGQAFKKFLHAKREKLLNRAASASEEQKADSDGASSSTNSLPPRIKG